MNLSRAGSRAIVIYCGVMMAISAFSVDITLPTFHAIRADLDAPFEFVQWTITIYMGAAGIAQLIWGSASDRFGRRPVLAAGLGLYLVGCLIAALAPNIETLLAARALQGFGAAAAIVLSRAIVRDLFSGEELARNLALATTIFAVGPIFAPLLGAAIGVPFGWRALFGVLGVFAVGLLFFLMRMPETNRARAADATRPAIFLQRTRRLFAHPQSRHFLILSTIIMSMMLLILAAAPRFYDADFGISGTSFAVFFAVHGLGIVVGQTANRHLIPLVGTVRAMLYGNLVLVAAAAAILVLSLAGWMNAYVMTALLTLFATSYLIVFSNAAAMVLDPHGDIAGFAAAFHGFMSQVGCAVIVSLVVLVTGESVVGFAAALLGICLVTLGGVVLWLRR